MEVAGGKRGQEERRKGGKEDADEGEHEDEDEDESEVWAERCADLDFAKVRQNVFECVGLQQHVPVHEDDNVPLCFQETLIGF